MALVKLNAYATLRAYLGGAASKEMEIQPGDQTRIIFVNSRAASLADRLHGGEHVGVFPAIGGG
jgi:hypothetical protein